MQYLKDSASLSSPVTLGAAVVGAAAASYYMYTRPEPRPDPLDFNNQSILLPDGSRTSVWAPDGQRDLVEYLFEDAQTTHQCFKRGVRISGDSPCLGTRNGPNREYTWLSYNEIYDRVKDFGAGLLQEGLEPRNDTFVGIYSANRVEWVVTEQACSMFSMVTISLYDTLGPDTCAYIIEQARISLVVCDKANKAQLLLDKADSMTSLKCIVVMDTISSANQEAAQKHNIKLVQFDDIMESGRCHPRAPVPPQPEDLAMICYTSGTTGDPKGVLLSHRNLISNLSAIISYATKGGFDFTKEHCHISYLPLAHMFERGLQVIMFMTGNMVGFSSGDVKLLTDDMQALQPSIFPTVPRLLNRMYDKVLQGIKSSALKTKLFQMAIASKQRELKRRIIRNNSIWDTLVFGKIQKLLGGKVELVFTASAPLEPKVLDFTRCAFGCVVVEGYGQTESTAGIAFNILGETEPGHVGPPLPCNVVKLVDVPEMDYYAKDNKGEVVCKGPNVFGGYYKNPEKTSETLDEEGWLHTGDIGQWLDNGVLKIIDRKKNIFKLSQGEYVAAEKIENTFMRSEFVAQVFVEGDSFKPYLMGVIVPDEEVIVPWARQNGVSGSFKEICASTKVKDTVLKDINGVGKKAGLKGFELVKDIILHPELFSIENDLLTPTFKNKRPQLRKFFKRKIDDLYSKHET